MYAVHVLWTVERKHNFPVTIAPKRCLSMAVVNHNKLEMLSTDRYYREIINAGQDDNMHCVNDRPLNLVCRWLLC